MPSYRVDVEPDVLIWARNRVGLTEEETAQAASVDPLTVRFWEAGAYELAQPTLVQLRKMARLYRVPLAALYFAQPPEEPVASLPDFRLLPLAAERDWSSQMFKTYYRVQMQREVAIELAQLLDEPADPISLLVDPKEKVEATARKIRTWLGVTLADQMTWKNQYQALNSWIAAVERHGILEPVMDLVGLGDGNATTPQTVPLRCV